MVTQGPGGWRWAQGILILSWPEMDCVPWSAASNVTLFLLPCPAAALGSFVDRVEALGSGPASPSSCVTWGTQTPSGPISTSLTRDKSCCGSMQGFSEITEHWCVEEKGPLNPTRSGEASVAAPHTWPN